MERPALSQTFGSPLWALILKPLKYFDGKVTHWLERAGQPESPGRLLLATEFCDFGVCAVQGGEEDACGCNANFGRSLVVDGVESAAAVSRTVALAGLPENDTMRSDTALLVQRRTTSRFLPRNG